MSNHIPYFIFIIGLVCFIPSDIKPKQGIIIKEEIPNKVEIPNKEEILYEEEILPYCIETINIKSFNKEIRNKNTKGIKDKSKNLEKNTNKILLDLLKKL